MAECGALPANNVRVKTVTRSATLTRTHRLVLLAVLILAWGVRLHRLGAESLWYDETVSVYLAQQSLPAIVAHTAGDIHPPAYYLLLHGWQALSAPSLAHGLEFLYAWISAACGMLIVALLYPIARRLYGSTTALIAAGLAAIHPFAIWYSQEVRMYTLGGALGLVCLWALLQWAGSTRKTASPGKAGGRVQWLAVYVLCAAAGLYTLYYFAFLLVAFNVAALGLWLAGGDKPRTRPHLRHWIVAQLAVVLLFAPWAPVFYRQAVDPPVPAWRIPWQSMSELLQALSESLSALIVGQSPPSGLLWPFALLATGCIALSAWSNITVARQGMGREQWLPVFYVTVPVAIIFVLTLTVTPIYQVRYLFPYAALFPVIAADALYTLSRRQRWVGFGVAALLALVSAGSVATFWSNAAYRADDHRAAVARLAKGWRPGDVILVNAGWVYTALEVYWPRLDRTLPNAAPPPLTGRLRLIDVATGSAQLPVARANDLQPQVVQVRTGSIDSSDNLGWGDPSSDFFAISAADTVIGLQRLAASYRRIWHYRLYDTVNDPNALIRNWLENNAMMVADEAIPGRDFGRLQLYDVQPGNAVSGPKRAIADFGAVVRLQELLTAPSISAGETLYAEVVWEAIHPEETNETETVTSASLAVSLRLYDANNALAAQQDVSIAMPLGSGQLDQHTRQVLSLPIAANTPPAEAWLEIVVYRQSDGAPLPINTANAGSAFITDGVRLRLQPITVRAPHFDMSMGR